MVTVTIVAIDSIKYITTPIINSPLSIPQQSQEEVILEVRSLATPLLVVEVLDVSVLIFIYNYKKSAYRKFYRNEVRQRFGVKSNRYQASQSIYLFLMPTHVNVINCTAFRLVARLRGILVISLAVVVRKLSLYHASFV